MLKLRTSARAFVGATALAGLAACALTFRSERVFTQSIELRGHEHLYLELPETDVDLFQLSTGTSAELSGTWYALGGTKKVAEDHVKAAGFDAVDIDDTVAALPYWPGDAEGLVGLELDSVFLPPHVDLSLRSEGGDLYVSGVPNFLDLRLEYGNALVNGSEEGVNLFTGEGSVQVRSARTPGVQAPIHVVTGGGSIEVDQHTPANVQLESAHGDVLLNLDSDLDVSLYVYGSQGVEVDTEQVKVSLPGGDFGRTLQDGQISIWVVALDGKARVQSP